VKPGLLEWQKKLVALFAEFDELSLLILKGHLLVEEALNSIIEKFVFHPEPLEETRLGFAQKVHLARSLSLDEQNNSMWALVLALNSLRNEIAHSLHSPKRDQKMIRVREIFVQECGDLKEIEDYKKLDDVGLMTLVISLCVGFLSSFEQEVIRLRSVVDELDRAMNPHRHPKETPH